MNYGKKSLLQKRNQLRNTQISVSDRVGKIAFRLIFFAIAAVIVIFMIQRIHDINTTLRQTPRVETVTQAKTDTSVVVDTDNKTIAVFEDGDLYRDTEDSTEIPESVTEVFVNWLDDSFYESRGSKLQRLIATVVFGAFQDNQSLPHPNSITERLIENTVYLGIPDETGSAMRQSIQARYLASQIEEKHSRKWILNHWFETINFGENIRGIRAAAQRFFGKKASELTVSEAAVLAAMVDDPQGCNPIKHPKINNQIRVQILEKMESSGLLDKAARDRAIRDSVYKRVVLVRNGYYEPDKEKSAFVRGLKEQLTSNLMERWGCTFEQAENILYMGGLHIQSTQNSAALLLAKQKADAAWSEEEYQPCTVKLAISVRLKDGTVRNDTQENLLDWLKARKVKDTLLFDTRQEAEDTVKEYFAQVKKSGEMVLGRQVSYITQPQASITLMEQKTGNIRAIIGERMSQKGDFAPENRTQNRVCDAGAVSYIPGTFAAALDNAGYTLSDKIRYQANETKNQSSVSSSTLREAIKSQNQSAALALTKALSEELCREISRKFALGDKSGEAGGVTNMEVASSYAAIANGGTYLEPCFYTEIRDSNGTVVLVTDTKDRSVIKDTTAFLLTDAMQDTVEKGNASLAKLERMPAAAQRGVGADGTGIWFAGYTPYYTCAVWTGYDIKKGLADSEKSLQIWYGLMQEIHKDLKATRFHEPDGIQKRTVCGLSDEAAIEGVCPKTYEESYAFGTAPSESCSMHETALVCKESGLLAGDDCPSESVEKRTFVRGSLKETERMPDRVCTLNHGKKQ